MSSCRSREPPVVVQTIALLPSEASESSLSLEQQQPAFESSTSESSTAPWKGAVHHRASLGFFAPRFSSVLQIKPGCVRLLGIEL